MTQSAPSPLIAVLLAALLATAACAPITESVPGPQAGALGVPSASLIYQQVSPSIAFIEVPAGTGSGILTELRGEKYVVTNAHVLWPYDAARVVFPDGAHYLDVPLVQSDQLVDLAILGPLDTTIPALPMGAATQIVPGEPVYLIGYPGEGELFPAPSITQGILSRTRIWDAVDSLRYYQTDAAGAGGQSGGVLVSSQGDILGITGMLFADAFILAASSADLTSRLDRMLDPPAVDDASASGAAAEQADSDSPTQARRRQRKQLESLWDTDGYFAYASRGDEIDVTARSEGDLGLALFDAGGEEIAYADNSFRGSETVSATVSIAAPQIVVVEQFLPGRTSYQLDSSHRMVPIPDVEDARTLLIGETVTGTIDYPADIDWFQLPLGRGEMVTVTVEATGIDALLSVGPAGQDESAYMEDDDSGRGLLGSNAVLEYEARRAADYIVAVRSFASADVGGYLLTVTASE